MTTGALALSMLLACTGVEPAFKRPNQVEVAPDGRVYVSDFHHQRIVELDSDGRVLRSFGSQGLGKGQLWQVWAMAADTDSSLLVLNQTMVDDGDLVEAVQVKRFREGREVEAAYLRGPGGEYVDVAEGIAPHPEGGYLVVASTMERIFHYDDSWVFQGAWGWAAREDESPVGVVLDGSDVWVVEQYAHRFRHLDASGTEIFAFRRAGDLPGQVSFPRGPDLCPGEWLAVADLGNHRVLRYDLDGRYLGGFAPEPSGEHVPVQVMDVGISPDCEHLWVADSKGNRVLRTSLTGEVEVVVSRW